MIYLSLLWWGHSLLCTHLSWKLILYNPIILSEPVQKVWNAMSWDYNLGFEEPVDNHKAGEVMTVRWVDSFRRDFIMSASVAEITHSTRQVISTSSPPAIHLLTSFPSRLLVVEEAWPITCQWSKRLLCNLGCSETIETLVSVPTQLGSNFPLPNLAGGFCGLEREWEWNWLRLWP